MKQEQERMIFAAALPDRKNSLHAPAWPRF
jgi:hypothetical protein